MREILFRGKDLQERNGWLYGYLYRSDINKRERHSGKATLIFTPDCDTFIYVPEYHNSWMVKAETVGRYTGLKDLHGTRIFEGDVIKSIAAWYVVEFENGGYGLRLFGKGTLIPIMGHGNFNENEVEVIGNVFDNPELLEG